MSYHVLGIAPEDRVALQVRNLTVTVGKQTTPADEELGCEKSNILEDISFDLKSGEMLAIMGGSGSGKTTLLNVLSQRLTVRNKGLSFSGVVSYQACNDSEHVKNAFMEQQDFLVAGLTVYEHLVYQADLRLPQSVSKKEKLDLIDSLIEILEIQHISNTVMMTFTHKTSFSGGERRRVSLAIQLLNKPSLLFLDEPTTGLDTSSSLKLIHVLRKLASSDLGVTIVLSIHQPRPEISVIFDKICLLTRGGRLVYFGNLVYSFEYFSKLNMLPHGMHKNDIMNFILDLSVKDTSSREKELETIAKINRLVHHWKNSCTYEPVKQVKFEDNLHKFETPRHLKISFFKEVEILTRRTWLLTFRDRWSYLSVIGLPLLLAVIVGWMFYKPYPDLASIRTKTSSLYVSIEIMGFIPLFIELERLWENDGMLFFKEYQENFVSIPGFIISRKLGKLLCEDIPISFAYSSITYFMWGLRTSEQLGGDHTASYFGIYLVVMYLVYSIGMASALACFAVSKDFPLSAMIQNIFYQLQNSACGYFVNAATMPVYVRWLKYICYFWYAFGALVTNQFSDWNAICPYDSEEKCKEYSGDLHRESLGFSSNWVAKPIIILVAWLFGFYIITYVAFKVRNFDVEMAKKKTHSHSEDQEILEEAMTQKPKKAPVQKENDLESAVSDDVSIQLRNISLTARRRKVPFIKPKPDFQLLNSITANFDANKINVVMGPSGSGKTTLLNLISNRLPKSTRFELEGNVALNNHQMISFAELSTVASYVTQFDSSLIPHLTVRETFYYQAVLRLPQKEHANIPSIINKLMRSMGLLDCADIMIGSNNLKGVSGGERRRVSIGIRLLSKPKILFLDEPTSGLDSSSSVTILKLLQQLTVENGTTIITTIHQPSPAMFMEFGSLLLLSKGGNVVYNGPAQNVVHYFAGLGFHKPQDINIADYILDVVSHSIDEDKDASDTRINRLLQEWKSHPIAEIQGSEKGINLELYRFQQLPFAVRLKTIMERQVLSSYRSRDALLTRSAQVVCLAIVHTLFFAPIRNTQEGISNRLGLIQEVLIFYFVGMINNSSVYPVERDLFYQEFKDQIYNNFEFQLCYFLNEIVIEFITCAIFSSLIVFAVGLPRTAAMYFSMTATCLVAVNCGESLGIMVNTLVDNIGLAINIMSNALTVAIFMAGGMSLSMPVLFRAFNYISPLKYGLGICAELSFRGQQFACLGGEADCTLSTGDALLSYYKLSSPIGPFYGALFACFFIYRIVGYLMVEVKIRYFL